MPNVLPDVGVISISENLIRWRIPYFFKLPLKFGTWIRSPSFNFKDKECELGIWPNGWDFITPEGWFSLFFLNRSDRNPGFKVRVGITDSRDEEICSYDAEWNTDLKWYMKEEFMEQKEVQSRRKEIAPDEHLRIICTVCTEREDHTGEASTQKDAEHVDEAADPSKMNKDGNVCQSNEAKEIRARRDLKNLDKLSQNFKELYLENKDCDLTIKVKDREFQTHRAILSARSTVFDKMLSHDMTENNSGVISIDDSDPEIFDDFLLFVYSGRVESLSDGNACGLYYAADKYDLPQLKEMCVQFLKETLSIETVCDIVCLAAKHREMELLEVATQFFARNMEEILVTVKWQLFVEKNPVHANELYIKALKLGYTKKS